MTPSEESDLIFFLGEGAGLLGKSLFGDQLERARNSAFDSEGKRIPLQDRSEWGVVQPKHQRNEPSYTPDERDVIRIARASRRIRAMAEPQARVLAVYYGNVGYRWKGTKVTQLFSLYPMTEAGQAALAQLPPSDERADVRLAGAYLPGGSQPNRALMLTCHSQARKLLFSALEAWEKTR